MNTSLLKDKDFIEYFKKEGQFFMETNNTPGTSEVILWETAKAVLRGKIIPYSIYKHKKEQKLEKDLHTLHRWTDLKGD